MYMAIHTINLPGFLQKKSAILSSDGIDVYNAIKNELEKGNEIQLDFDGLNRVTTSFLNSAIGTILVEFGGELLTQSKLTFKNITSNTLQHKLDEVINLATNTELRQSYNTEVTNEYCM
jgi:hypothetical protein